MTEANHTHILSDGRKLGFMEYGDPTGFPVFAFHGTPGSRIWFKEDEEISKALGIQLITVDRPGFGISDQNAARTFLQFADDICELSQFLNLNKFSVMGVSGGGAYSAACAYKYPDLIYKAGLISTTNQFENGKPPKEMAFANRMAFTLAKRFPRVIKYVLNQQKNTIEHNPDKYIESISKNTKHLCESDREIIAVRENAEAVMIQMKEAFKNGVAGTVYEMRLYTREWGFDCTKIKVPVTLWHGSADTLVPISSAQELARKIPDCDENYAEGKGHFLTDDEDIWRNILTSLKG
ncbi:MAG: alpha/beta hydrolase [Roseivirga sp.]|nr:alpha/beta hydrolase [Roseivirga sp.]